MSVAVIVLLRLKTDPGTAVARRTPLTYSGAWQNINRSEAAPMIRQANSSDAQAICAIYNHYVETSTISFEEQAVPAEQMAERIAAVSASLPWFVFERDGQVAGYAYATPWRVRRAYRFSVESTVYVAPGQAGQGIGKALYQALIGELRVRGVHAVIGGIALPNADSVALHERFGFDKVALFREVGRKFGRWVDVGYWELLLNGDDASEDGMAGPFA